jgi:hypothetical protein
VALAIGAARHLYVADAEQQAVLVYDSFGTFRRRVPTPPLPDVQALALHRGRLHIVSPDTVRIWDRTDAQVAAHSVALSESLVDIARTDGEVYLLTETRLLRRTGW